MGDTLGAVATFLGGLVAWMTGLNKLVGKSLKEIPKTAGRAWTYMQYQFNKRAAKMIWKVLFGVAGLELILYLLAMWAMGGFRNLFVVYWGYTIAFAVVYFGTIALGTHQSLNAPKPKKNSRGEIMTYPPYLLNERYIPIDRTGQELPHVNGVPNDPEKAMRHPLAGEVMLTGFKRKRFYFTLSVLVIFLGLLTVSMGLCAVGLLESDGIQREGNTIVFSLGFGTIMMLSSIVRAAVLIGQWAGLRSNQLVESIGTIMARVSVIPLPGYTAENVFQEIAKLEILKGEDAMIKQARLRWAQFLNTLMIIGYVICGFTYLITPFAVIGLMLGTEIFGWAIIQLGRRGKEKEQKKRESLGFFLREWMPPLVTIALVWKALAYTSKLLLADKLEQLWLGIKAFWASIGATWHAFFTLENFCAYTPQEWYYRVLTFLFVGALALTLGVISYAIHQRKIKQRLGARFHAIASIASILTSVFLVIATGWIFSTMIARHDERCTFMDEAAEAAEKEKAEQEDEERAREMKEVREGKRVPQGYDEFRPLETPPTQAKASKPAPNTTPPAPPPPQEAPSVEPPPPARETVRVPAPRPQPRQTTAPRPRPAPTRTASNRSCPGCNPEFAAVLESF